MTKIKIGSAALGLILAAGLHVAAQAQPAAGPGPRQGAERMQRLDTEAMAARRAEHLRAALQLRPDQEAALRTFVDAAKRPARADRVRPTPGQGLTTPQRLDRQQAMMRERMARFEQRAEATKRFYAALSPAQQKAFDAMKPGDGKRGGRHGRPGGHRGAMTRG